MGFNRTRSQCQGEDNNSQAVVNMLDEDFDGYILLGYRKGDHDKVVVVRGEEPACRDALTFFFPAVEAWKELARDEGDESEAAKD